MNKRIDFDNLGGYPLAQEDLDWTQTSFRAALAAIANFIGDKVIISGMVEQGGEVTAGWISIGGEIVPFQAGAIGGGNFLIDETSTDLTFEDGGVKTVLFERIAKFAIGGEFLYADLKRIGTVGSIAAALTALTNAFNAHTHAWAAITDKPLGYIPYVSAANIGNIPANDGEYLIIIPDQGGTNYIVAGSLRGLNANSFLDNDVSWVVTKRQSDRFSISIREYEPAGQNLVFDFAIIKSL